MDIFHQFAQYFFGIVFTCLSLIYASGVWLRWKRGKNSLNWPTTTGEILTSSVESIDDSYKANVKYVYLVDGKEHEGATITFADYQVDAETAQLRVARFPEGARVPVYYNPKSPKVSTLEIGNGPVRYPVLAGIILLILLVAGISLLIGGLPWEFVDLRD
jgi:hypothetical protein